MDIRRLDDGRTVVELTLYGCRRRIVQGDGSPMALEELSWDAVGEPIWIPVSEHTQGRIMSMAFEELADEVLRLREENPDPPEPEPPPQFVNQVDCSRPPEEHGVGRYLDVSTVHAPSNEAVERAKVMAAALDGTPGSEWRIMELYDEGFFGYVPEDEDEDEPAKEAGVPGWLTNIWKLARQKGCYLIRMDRDAPEHEELRRYEWQ